MKKHYPFILLLAVLPGVFCSSEQTLSTSGTVKAGNFHVYYERTGKGEAILLLHAGLQDHTMWKDQVDALSKDYEVITPDLPYHGKTTGVDTTILVADVIKTLLDSLHIQKASVVGLSMGGGIAQDFIIAYPQMVNKAFLISTGVSGYDKIHPVDSVSMDWWNQFSKALHAGDTAGAAKEFTKAWAEGIYRRGDSLKAPVSQYVYKTTLENLRIHKMENWPRFQEHPPGVESLSTINVPVLIIYGDKDLPFIISASEYLEKNIPGARHVVMKDVAHMLNMEKPDELNKLMIDFLKAK